MFFDPLSAKTNGAPQVKTGAAARGSFFSCLPSAPALFLSHYAPSNHLHLQHCPGATPPVYRDSRRSKVADYGTVRYDRALLPVRTADDTLKQSVTLTPYWRDFAPSLHISNGKHD